MSELTLHYQSFHASAQCGDFCGGETCRGWFLSEVDTWHRCSCPAGRRPSPAECEDGPSETDDAGAAQ